MTKRKSKALSAPQPEVAVALAPVVAALTEESGRTGQRTAKLAAEILRDLNVGFVIPTAKQRVALAMAYARAEYVIYGKAFDIVRCSSTVDLNDSDSIFEHLADIVILEIKSTNKKTVKPDFRGHFFAITAAELLVAQSLGKRYRFIFVNTLTRSHLELTLQQIFARSRGIYPTWSISF